MPPACPTIIATVGRPFSCCGGSFSYLCDMVSHFDLNELLEDQGSVTWLDSRHSGIPDSQSTLFFATATRYLGHAHEHGSDQNSNVRRGLTKGHWKSLQGLLRDTCVDCARSEFNGRMHVLIRQEERRLRWAAFVGGTAEEALVRNAWVSFQWYLKILPLVETHTKAPIMPSGEVL